MTKAELIDAVADRLSMTKKEVTSVLEVTLDVVKATLRKHKKVQLSGFGTFEPRQRKARVARNPRTQEAIRVGASWSVGFRAGKQLKAVVSGKAGAAGGR